MNILNVLIKEFKQNIRNWKANIMMVLFPIVLIMILGAAFTGQFDRTVKLGNIKVLYTAQSSKELNDSFKSFTADLGKNMGVSFREISDVNEGISSVKDTEYSCYIILSNNPEEFKIYKNARFNSDANLVESMVKSFASRYSAIAQIARSNHQVVGKILADNTMDFVKTESLDRKRQPGSLDYYAVSMLSLILMYSSLTGFWAIKSEKNMRTGNRMLCSPISKYEVLTGKVLGSIAVTLLQASVVILFSKYVLKAYWGSDILTVLLVIAAESIMAISMGTGIAYLIKNDGAASGLLNSIIPVIVFLGGGYVPLSVMGEGIAKFSDFSPVKWVNDAIFRVIYDSDYSHVLTAILINLAVAAGFIIISAMFSKKEVA